MKTAVLSDIAGNYPALKAVLEDAKKQGCTTHACCGDLVGYFAFPNECIESEIWNAP